MPFLFFPSTPSVIAMSRPKTHLASLLKPLIKARAIPASASRAPSKAKPTPDEQQLLREAMRDVTPLQRALPYPHPGKPTPPWPLKQPDISEQDRQDFMSDFWPWDGQSGDTAKLFVRSGQKLDTLRKLRRGHWPIQGELDLHGMDSDAARAAVGSFILRCVNTRRRCVRIVHGKGLGSRQGEPVLKHKLRNWLVQRDEVQAFCEPEEQAGGAGALLILLRSPKS